MGRESWIPDPFSISPADGYSAPETVTRDLSQFALSIRQDNSEILRSGLRKEPLHRQMTSEALHPITITMKQPIAITFLCTFLFACQASDLEGHHNSIPIKQSSPDTTIEIADAVDGPSIATAMVISARFTADGPNGPEPYTYVAGTVRSALGSPSNNHEVRPTPSH
ncbi:MAG: hypothetical protein ACI9X4_002889 [Glaciecola sp.]|jgi:hypothetical protein